MNLVDGKIVLVTGAARSIGAAIAMSMAKEGAPFNINVNSIAPGLIGTEMTKTFGYDKKVVPIGRIGTAQDVADTALFLASEMSGYITGACIDVNGGMTMW